MFQELLEKTVLIKVLTGQKFPKTNRILRKYYCGSDRNRCVQGRYMYIGQTKIVYRVDIDVYESGENRCMCACINKLKLGQGTN